MNGVRVMAARFASTCGACGGAIRKGAQIQYVKGAAATHAACAAPVLPTGAGRGFVVEGRHYRGKCIDAPCCGCCS